MEIKSLETTDTGAIFNAFNRAFADYEHQVNNAQFQAMLKRRGFNPALSFAAFDQNEIVAFTLNGTGTFNGILTAYDTGTGTLKDYRGRGLATQVFEYSLPYLREAGIRQYLLEVLQHNTAAVSVYRNLGFEVTREFNYFIRKKEDIKNETSGSLYPIKEINIEEFISIPGFWDFHPSWQNSFESIKRADEEIVSLGVFSDDKLVGYCVFEPACGDVAQIAVDKQNRRKGIGSALLGTTIELCKSSTIRVINAELSCDSMTCFLRAKNMEVTGRQFEMAKNI